jgi:hypothetical protein
MIHTQLSTIEGKSRSEKEKILYSTQNLGPSPL